MIEAKFHFFHCHCKIVNFCDTFPSEDDILDLKKEKRDFQENIHHYFMSVLMTAKPKVDCEKKFCDIR